MNSAVECAEKGDYKGFWEACEMFPEDWLTVYWKATCLFRGRGCEQNTAQGERLVAEILPSILMLAGQGDAIAQHKLGVLYANGWGAEMDAVQAAMWYRKAAEQGHVNAQYNLARMYENGRGVEKDDVQAVTWYRKAAEQGQVNAQYNLARMYENGLGVKKDEAQAVEWCRKAAEQGHVNAQYSLARMYENGLGVKKDEAQAVEWYRKAAEQGDADAQFNLGNMYADGCGVEKDEARAVEWYRKAAEQGQVNAQYNLARMYENGCGVEKDESQAVEWYRKAAEQGHVKAQSNLERMLANGRGVEKDDAKAAPWCRKATEQGRDLSLYCEAGHSLFDNYIANEVSSALREAIKGESFCSVDAVYVNVTYEWFNVIVSLADYTLGGQIIERNVDFLIAVVADVVAPKIGVATDELKKKGRLIIGLDGVGAQLVFHVAVLPDPFVMFSKSVEGKRLKDGALLERYAKEGVLSPVRLFLHNQYRECVIDVQRGCFKIEKHLGKFVTLLIKWPRPPEELCVDQLLSTQPNFHSLTLEYDADHVVSRCYIPKIGLSRNIRDFNVPIWHISDKPEVSSTGLAYNPNRFADFVDAVSARRPTKDEIDGYYDLMDKLLVAL